PPIGRAWHDDAPTRLELGAQRAWLQQARAQESLLDPHRSIQRRGVEIAAVSDILDGDRARNRPRPISRRDADRAVWLELHAQNAVVQSLRSARHGGLGHGGASFSL